jgi:AcrR family transcriptional regulator
MAKRNGRRTQDPATSINAILDAAARVFAARGYDGASIDDVAAELGSTKGRVYHYWSGKQGLLAAVQRRGIERTIAAVEPIATDDALSALDRLERMIRAHVSSILSDLDYQRVLLQSVDMYAPAGRARADLASINQQINGLRRYYEELFTDLVAAGQRAGTVAGNDPLLTTRALLGTLNWVCVWHRRPADERQREQRDSRTIHELSEFAIRGLRR